MTTYCSKCGEKNEDDAKFCRKCGMSLNSKIMKVNNEENDNTKKYIIIANSKKSKYFDKARQGCGKLVKSIY